MALTLLKIDVHYLAPMKLGQRFPELFGAGAEAARQMLSMIAGAAMGVAGISFSITVVVLCLASSQYSPRVLRNFIRDWRSQMVLGGFLGTFAYCLVVLKTIRGESEFAFIPPSAILGSVLLAFVVIALLVYFIDHIASSIQASSIVKAIYTETLKTMDYVFPHKQSEENEIWDTHRKIVLASESLKWQPVMSQTTGYVQSVDLERLVSLSRKHKLPIKMAKAPGEFVVFDTPLVWVPQDFDHELSGQVCSAYSIDISRTMEQEVGFGIRQLVDVALKGLSPGINDVTSSEICIDYIGALLRELVSRPMTLAPIFENDSLRVVRRSETFSQLIHLGFDQIRRCGEEKPTVLLRLEMALDSIQEKCVSQEHQKEIQWQKEVLGVVKQASKYRYEDLNLR